MYIRKSTVAVYLYIKDVHKIEHSCCTFPSLITIPGKELPVNLSATISNLVTNSYFSNTTIN